MRAKKQFGQHFLRDQSVIKKIISSAEITPGEEVLEIGPGEGVLTQALLSAGARVTAVEIDRDLIDALRERFGKSLNLIEGDILSVPLCKLPATSYKLVANLPYNIASAVLEKFFTLPEPPTRFVVMVQREVGERILAQPPHMSLLSVACQMYADARRVTRVPPGAFSPPPKVDSLVVRMDWHPRVVDPESVIALAKKGFVHPRKQLHRNMEPLFAREKTKKFLASRSLPETARAQELSVDDWIAIRAHNML
ncbi:ribosomal RNA small subunit methyltransferase A [Candidatus Uhrbacteria bacterium]|nr:ribosomal RNA small subunit methyltransferase A [Candidatus Uhrbacteria bacterium]